MNSHDKAAPVGWISKAHPPLFAVEYMVDALAFIHPTVLDEQDQIENAQQDKDVWCIEIY